MTERREIVRNSGLCMHRRSRLARPLFGGGLAAAWAENREIGGGA